MWRRILGWLAAAVLVVTAADAGQRVYLVRFEPVPDAAVYALAHRVGDGEWSEQTIGAVPRGQLLEALALVDVPDASELAFRVHAIRGDQTSAPSNIVTLRALPERCDITGNGTVSALDGARILQHVVGLQGACP